MDKISFLDLNAIPDSLKRDIKSNIQNVIDTNSFILGPMVSSFEMEFASFNNSEYCIGVGSGTEALHLALRALGIQRGDEVITVANTFVATPLSITYTGATPVLVDIDPMTYNIDINDIENKITSKTRCIIPVHLYGRSVDMKHIMSIARKYNLFVVEDCSQAHGSYFDDIKVGNYGDIGCFSFYPGKNMGAFGDAGAIVTNNKEIADHLFSLRNYGSRKKYFHDEIGYNCRLDSIQAGVLKAKIHYMEEFNNERRCLAQRYNTSINRHSQISLPPKYSENEHVFHLYVIRTSKRDELANYLKKANIDTVIHYPIPVNKLGAFSDFELANQSFPEAEQAAEEILSLPLYPGLKVNQLEYVADKINSFFEEI